MVLPHLQANEKRFFEMVADGNVAEVRSFLEEYPDFNVNAVNFQVSTRTCHDVLKIIMIYAENVRNKLYTIFFLTQNKKKKKKKTYARKNI